MVVVPVWRLAGFSLLHTNLLANVYYVMMTDGD
jgi:hypothetical protein